MATEGQVAIGPNGERAVFRGGQWVVIPAGPEMPADPTFPYQGAQAAAGARKTTVDANVAEATAPSVIRKTQAEAAATEVETDAKVREARLWENAQERKAIRQAFQTDSILRSIRNARRIAQEEGGTGWASLLAGVPTTAAKKLQTELSPVFGNLAFDRLQQMRDESPTGGAVGQVSERELDLLASTVASLDQAVDLPTFLERLDTIERHFIGMQLNALGVDPTSDEGRKAYKDEYGYTGVFSGETPEEKRALGAADATQTRGELPEEYQREHLRYLRDNWGNIDPGNYVRFRAALDEAFGQTPDLNAYAAASATWNDFAAQGGTPEALGAVPGPNIEMGAVEQGINRAAQSAPGAAFANATNAFAAGLPAQLGGAQDQLELLREARPYSSALGEMVGGGVGAATLGGGAAMLGGRAASMLANPLASELLHGSVYGATQDDNMLRGAAYGAGGALAGGVIGGALGRQFPQTFAPAAIRQADESVPSATQLQERAADLYADVAARGVAAGPQETGSMFERAQRVLAGQGRIGGDGRVIISDGPTRQAYEQLESFAGGTMSPTQAQTVRETLGEGLTSNVPKERRIASLLLNEFDDWAAPVMPGADAAREVSSRYIRGQQLENLTDRAIGRGRRLRGSDDAAQVRTLYGQLDEKIGQGQAFFDTPTAEQISRVAQGDRLTNALRWLGKFSPQNVMPALGQGGGAIASVATGNPIPAMAAAGMAGAGMLGRKISNDRTLRAAQEAELFALGGPEYGELLEAARALAAARGGRILGGGTGAATSVATRPEPLR